MRPTLALLSLASALGVIAACGSDSAKAPATAFPPVSAVTNFFFCASVPNALINSPHMLVTAIPTEVDAQAALISIIASA